MGIKDIERDSQRKRNEFQCDYLSIFKANPQLFETGIESNKVRVDLLICVMCIKYNIYMCVCVCLFGLSTQNC